jgi:hypothetical protein
MQDANVLRAARRGERYEKDERSQTTSHGRNFLKQKLFQGKEPTEGYLLLFDFRKHHPILI